MLAKCAALKRALDFLDGYLIDGQKVHVKNRVSILRAKIGNLASFAEQVTKKTEEILELHQIKFERDYSAVEVEFNILLRVGLNLCEYSIESSPQELIAALDSLIRQALGHNQPIILDFLFNEIMKTPVLRVIFLPFFLDGANLTWLKGYVENKKIPIINKLATEFRSGENSGEMLIKSLLRSAENRPERLKILKAATEQWMLLEYISLTVTAEPCYAEREHLEQLAAKPNDEPIKAIAQDILDSIKFDSLQGRVAVGWRVLANLLDTVINSFEQFEFHEGIHFLELLLMELHGFYKVNNRWPDDWKLARFMQTAEAAANTLILSKPAAKPQAESSPDAITAARRFRAMAGGSIFGELNRGLPLGGYAKEACEWYSEILPVLVRTMEQVGILGGSWNEEKARRLLFDISTSPRHARDSSTLLSFIQLAGHESEKAIGYELHFSQHFIPSCLYVFHGEWRYTIMCRGCIPGSAIEFIIPEDRIPALLSAINKQHTPRVKGRSHIAREVWFGLLNHLLDVQKLTGSTCTYSQRHKQKPYKVADCFASNIKPFFPILLSIMAKPGTTPEQWSHFNAVLKVYILDEMSRAGVSLEAFHREIDRIPEKPTEPLHIAYKLMTTLIRWIEINRFSPTNTTETDGKAKTIEHVLDHTKDRFRLFRSGPLKGGAAADNLGPINQYATAELGGKVVLA